MTVFVTGLLDYCVCRSEGIGVDKGIFSDVETVETKVSLVQQNKTPVTELKTPGPT